MGLIDEFMFDCIMIDKSTSPDGYGGVKTDYHDGAPFTAAITFHASVPTMVAQNQGVRSVYTVTTSRNIVLDYHQIFRRVQDGKYFRVRTDGEDSYTPQSATLDMRQCMAEEWSLPSG